MEDFVVDKNHLLFFLRNVVLQAENEREKDEVMEKLLNVYMF